MKFRNYHEPPEQMQQIDKKILRKEREKLHMINQLVALESIDKSGYTLLDGKHAGITFKLGIGATQPGPVALRVLAYASIALTFAATFEGRVEFVSGGGIASSCGIVHYPTVVEQVTQTCKLIKRFRAACFPQVPILFSSPVFDDTQTIRALIESVERHTHGKRVLEYLGAQSLERGLNRIQGKEYGVLHAFAFDLRNESEERVVTIGNRSEDPFNTVREAVLAVLNETPQILQGPYYAPQTGGHIITSRCSVPPYGIEPSWYDPPVSHESIEMLLQLQREGRETLLKSIAHTHHAQKASSILKDFEFLIRIVPLEEVIKVVRAHLRTAQLEDAA